MLRLGADPRVAVPSDGLRGLGEVVVDVLRTLHGAEPVLQVGGEGDLNLVLLRDPPVADVARVQGIDPLDEGDAGRELYELDVRERGATVTASWAEGLFRGAMTFAQLLRPEQDGGGFTASGTRIADGPAWAWRGLSLDVVRRFFTVEQVKKVIDLLAFYKFNVLHLHLSDSQAWRLQIEAWPRLTGDLPHNTQDDYREIVAYAAARYVTVVPELDMPGHVLAAVRAYPELQGDAEPPHKYLAYLDPRAEVTFRFVRDVLGEVAALTPGAYQPRGGDEAFGMTDAL